MRFKKPKSSVVDVDMTPMIDIVFQLIAFFMVITNFEQTQADERVILAKDQLAVPPQVKREHELVLNVGFIRDQNGDKVDPEPFVFYSGMNLRVAEIEPKLRVEAQLYKDRQVPIKDVSVVIRADAEVPTGLVQELIKMSQGQGIEFEKFAIKARQTLED
jgi:biopolymer transport protein ExbD